MKPFRIHPTPDSYYHNPELEHEDPHYSDDTSPAWVRYFDDLFCKWAETQPEFDDERYGDGFPDDVKEAMLERFEEAEGDVLQETYVEWLGKNSYSYDPE
jgi:hypothetical protein